MANKLIITKSGTSSKPSLFRILTWIVAHMTIFIVIYSLFKISVLLLATVSLEGREPVSSITNGCSTKVGEKSTSGSPCDTTKKLFGIDILHPKVNLFYGIIIFLVVSALNLPQLYGGLKLIQAVDLKSCQRNSIALAFLYQKIQFIVTTVELLLFGIVINSGYDDLWNDESRHLCFMAMQGIFCKMAFIFTVESFIDELLRISCENKDIIMITESSITYGIPTDIWNLENGMFPKVPVPASGQDQVVIV